MSEENILQDDPVVVADEDQDAALENQDELLNQDEEANEADDDAAPSEKEQEGAEEDEDKEPEQKPKWFRDTIARMGRQKAKAEDRARAEAERNAKLAKELAELRAKVDAANIGDAPKIEDYGSTEEHIAALVQWEMKKRDAENAAKVSVENEQTTAKTAEEQFFSKRDEVFDSMAEKFGDQAIEKVLAIPTLSREFAEDVFATDNPADLLNFLAENHEEVSKLSGMNPRQRAIALGRLETRLTAKPTKKQTSAPPPVKPVSGKSGVPKPQEIPDDTEELAAVLAKIRSNTNA